MAIQTNADNQSDISSIDEHDIIQYYLNDSLPPCENKCINTVMDDINHCENCKEYLKLNLADKYSGNNSLLFKELGLRKTKININTYELRLEENEHNFRYKVVDNPSKFRKFTFISDQSNRISNMKSRDRLAKMLASEIEKVENNMTKDYEKKSEKKFFVTRLNAMKHISTNLEIFDFKISEIYGKMIVNTSLLKKTQTYVKVNGECMYVYDNKPLTVDDTINFNNDDYFIDQKDESICYKCIETIPLSRAKIYLSLDIVESYFPCCMNFRISGRSTWTDITKSKILTIDSDSKHKIRLEEDHKTRTIHIPNLLLILESEENANIFTVDSVKAFFNWINVIQNRIKT
ncbi:hypothetical protein A0H76_1758 [Hepatospora eriocheir]|uniref:PH domain-containing protein n=1 Tax=Hepatospora eriocheir TaxID=1081669 RepID=A0A1X0QKG2_9MICR|nr:hypothetical protein A0H76_1758 [Hepatospora eriocheir]